MQFGKSALACRRQGFYVVHVFVSSCTAFEQYIFRVPIGAAFVDPLCRSTAFVQDTLRVPIGPACVDPLCRSTGAMV